MKKLLFLILITIIFYCCKISSASVNQLDSIYIQIDTANTVIINDYLTVEADVINNSSDTILFLLPKESINEKVDYFSINLDQGEAKECGVETFEVPVRQEYRFSREFVKIDPKEQIRIRLDGRAYNQIIYCPDPRPIELEVSYEAMKFNGENSQIILKTYIETDRRELFASTVSKFSSLYEGKIKSNIVKFTPNRN